MPRFKLTIEYDGGPYQGWQTQRSPELKTVQGELGIAVFRMTGETVTIAGAGRTDAGVHATAQVAHIDLTRDWRDEVVRDGLNAHLRPNPIAVLRVEKVPDTFDARFSAKARHYRYRIANRRTNLALETGRTWRVPRKINVEAMHEAAQLLIGKHDFTTFRSTECQAKSPIRNLDVLNVSRHGEEIWIEASARSFLHNQVRSIVGSLEHVGSGKWSAADLKQALEARTRTACGHVAPPEGLYLIGVDYPAF